MCESDTEWKLRKTREMVEKAKRQDKEQLICCICHKPIPVKGTWAAGNNAEPVANGRCCDDCDDNVVIPARVAEMYMRRGLTREEATKVAEGVKNTLAALTEKEKNATPEQEKEK